MDKSLTPLVVLLTIIAVLSAVRVGLAIAALGH